MKGPAPGRTDKEPEMLTTLTRTTQFSRLPSETERVKVYVSAAGARERDIDRGEIRNRSLGY